VPVLTNSGGEQAFDFNPSISSPVGTISSYVPVTRAMVELALLAATADHASTQDSPSKISRRGPVRVNPTQLDEAAGQDAAGYFDAYNFWVSG